MAKKKRKRERVAPGIWRDGDTYQIYVYIGGTSKHVGSKPTVEEAKTFRASFAGEDPAAVQKVDRRKTFAAYVAEWIVRIAPDSTTSERKYKPSTFRSAVSHIENYLLPVFGNEKLSALTRERINSLTPKIKAGLTPVRLTLASAYAPSRKAKTVRRAATLSEKSRKNVMLTLKSILRDAEADGLIRSNPTTRMTMPTVPRTRPDAHDPAMIVAITAEMRSPLKEAALLSLACGARQGELLALTWADIHADQLEIEITKSRDQLTGEMQPPKSAHSVRAIVIDAQTVAFLGAYKQRLRAGLVSFTRVKQEDGTVKRVARAYPPYTGPHLFPSFRTGKPIDAGWVAEEFRRAARELYPDLHITWHHLRHAYASMILSAIGDSAIHDVQHNLGHATPSFTRDTYVHRLPKHHRGRLEVAGRTVFGPKAEGATLPPTDPTDES